MRQARFFTTLVLAIAVLGWAGTVSAAAAKKASTKHASGTVKSVSGSSLTVTGADKKDWTFTVDDKTMVTGAGLSTIKNTIARQHPLPAEA